VGPDAAEELTDLPLPPLQVPTENGLLLVVGDLGGGEPFAMPAEEKLPLTGDAEVPYPLRVAARRDEVPRPVERQNVQRVAARRSRLAAPHLEHARAPDADAEPRRRGNDPVEDVAREPARNDVALCHRTRPYPSRLATMPYVTSGARVTRLLAVPIVV